MKGNTVDRSKHGTAGISPDVAYAGQKGQWQITYVVGAKPIKQGGGLRIATSRLGQDHWQLGKVLAFCDNPAVQLEVTTENTYPQTLHHSKYPAVTVIVYGCDLAQGEKISIVLGAIGGYVSGRFIQTQAQLHTGLATFAVYVDHLGNGGFCRERIRPEAYQQVPGKLTVTVKPAAPAKIRTTVRANPHNANDGKLVGVVSVEDEYDNPIVDEAFDTYGLEGKPTSRKRFKFDDDRGQISQMRQKVSK